MTATDAHIKNLMVRVVDGPMEGLGLARSGGKILIGRGAQSDIALAKDPWVSRVHVSFALEGGSLFAQDEGGRNGTWLVEGRIHDQVPLAPGTVAVVGRTPVQVDLSPDAFDHSAPPAPLQTFGSLETILRKAMTDSSRKRSSCITSANLLQALFADPDDEVHKLLKDLRANSFSVLQSLENLWGVSHPWITAMLEEARSQAEGSEPELTPGAIRAVHKAVELAKGTGADQPGGADLLVAIAHKAPEPLLGILTGAGLSFSSLEGWISKARSRPQEGDQTMQATGIEAQTISEPATMEPSPKEPVEKTVPQPQVEKIFRLKNFEDFQEAKELENRIQAVQASYHLADPGQRAMALTEAIQEAVAGMVPEKRDRVLENLEDLFPVLADAPQSLAQQEELENLREENQRLRARIRAMGEKRQEAPAPSFENLLVAITSGQETLSRLPEDEQASARTLQSVLAFAKDLERLITSLVQSFQTGGAELTRYVIPPFRKNLTDLLEQAGPAPDAKVAEQIDNYLAAVRGWLIASIMGYSRASGEYCRQLLARIDPHAMEKQTELPRWRDAMGLADSDLWKRFKEIYADLQVDLVDDHVQEKAAALAGEEFRKLKQKPTGRNTK